ncbi:hypothetical protein [Rhodanobacter sp. Root627]|jgi:hypothetical protein|uniref:hypothetical protein n=1 Tax=Rhodanobacter sp. Root627 TaxID=1736572 RepID=UPI0012E36D84|nr:hypothetical protein [Rhodanobacter sp. Root627]
MKALDSSFRWNDGLFGPRFNPASARPTSPTIPAQHARAPSRPQIHDDLQLVLPIQLVDARLALDIAVIPAKAGIQRLPGTA